MLFFVCSFFYFFFLMIRRLPRSTLFPYTTLSRSAHTPAATIGTVMCLSMVSRSSGSRSEEHTSELQSRQYLVSRLLLEKKKQQNNTTFSGHRKPQCTALQAHTPHT